MNRPLPPSALVATGEPALFLAETVGEHDIQLKPVDCYVSLLGLWRALGIEFLVNLDRKSYKLRFLRKFWEQYLSYIIRGKELWFEFEVIKEDVTKKAQRD